jgi:hypothetical protein
MNHPKSTKKRVTNMLRTFLVLILVMVFAVDIQFVVAQEFPKVPADRVKYIAELNAIKLAGFKYRIDWVYYIQGGNVTGEEIKERILKFDENGRVKEIEVLEPLGEVISIIALRYNSRSLPTADTEFMPTGELIGKTKYQFDKFDRLNEITWYNGFEYIISKQTNEVNEEKQSITERQYYSPDSVIKKTIFYYSNLDSGFVKEELGFTGENAFGYRKVYHRDSNNRIENEEFLNESGEQIGYLEYKYNPGGFLIAKDKISKNTSKLRKNDYQYNEAGFLIKEIEYNNRGEIVSYRRYDYE